MGAWIETNSTSLNEHFNSSHPSWVRGLKQTRTEQMEYLKTVAPLVGAWIETAKANDLRSAGLVAPLVGAWIETKCCPFIG